MRVIANITTSDWYESKDDSDFRGKLFLNEVVPMIKKMLSHYNVPSHLWDDYIYDLYESYERAMNTYSPSKGAISTHIYNVIKNDLINKIRNEKERNISIEEYLKYIPSFSSTPEQEYLAKENIRKIEELLEKMDSDRDKDILTYLLEGYTPEDISAMTGYSEKSISNIITKTILPKVKMVLRTARKKKADDGDLPDFPDTPMGMDEQPMNREKKDPDKKAKELVLKDLEKIKIKFHPKSKKEFLKYLKDLGWTTDRLIELFGDKFSLIFG